MKLMFRWQFLHIILQACEYIVEKKSIIKANFSTKFLVLLTFAKLHTYQREKKYEINFYDQNYYN